jgi:hypothetical protein
MEEGENVKNKILAAFWIITILLLVFTCFIYLQQTTQASTLTDWNGLKNPSISLTSKRHLTQLGFSDVAISSMSPEEVHRYEKVNGKIVYNRTIFVQIKNTGVGVKYISKSKYNKLLQQYSKSKFLHKPSLERVDLKLVYEGKRKFFMIEEHHFDYTPSDLKPMMIEVQYRDDYIVSNQFAKQIWWTTSLLNSKNIQSGTKSYPKPNLIPTNEDSDSILFKNNQGRDNYNDYQVNWKASSFLQDVVGLHLYNTAEFQVPKDYIFADIYIQGQNPHLSEQLSYEFKKK